MSNLIDNLRCLLDKLNFREVTQSCLHTILLRHDFSHLFLRRIHQALQPLSLSFLICLKLLKLFVDFFHEVCQFYFIFVPFLDKHFFISFNDGPTLIFHLSELIKKCVNLVLGFVVDFVKFDIVMLAMKWVLYDCIRAKRLLTSLTIEEHFRFGMFCATYALLLVYRLD